MDTRYLKLRRQTWYAQVAVPSNLTEVLGKKVILQSLKTRDLKEAQQLRWEVVNEVKAGFSKLHRLHKAPPPKGSTAELLAHGETLRQQVRQRVLHPVDADEQWDLLLDSYLDRRTGRRTGEPEVSDGDAQAIKDLGLAIGDTKARLLSDAIDTHLTELTTTARPSTIAARRRRLQAFAAWLGGDPLLTSITDDHTSRYLTEVLMKQGLATKTIKDTLSDLSSLWKWAKGRRLGVKENPWTGLSGSLPKQKRGVADSRRPWNVQELMILLSGIPTADTLWAMSVLALYTGMRANEIAEIRLKDIHTAHIEIPEAKTEAGKRDVPLHPVIRPLVQHLKKTSTDGYLIEGLTRGGADGKRAHYIMKRFGRMKVRLGLTDSCLVFHSLRNTFIHQCENAGVPENVAKLIVGHSRQSQTFGGYSPGVNDRVLQRETRKVSYGKRVDGLVAERIGELTEVSKGVI